MAYAFNNVMNMMDKNKQQGSSSIPSQAQGLQKNMGTGEGEMGASNTATSSTKAPQDFTKSGATSAKTILDRNKNVQNVGAENRVLGDAQSQYSGALKQMQNQSEDYLKAQGETQKNLYGTPDTSAVNKAVSGDQDSYSKVLGLMNAKPGKAGDFTASYKPLAANEYNRSQDLSNPLMSNSSSGYNRGMAALDSTILRRGDTQQRIQNQLGQMNTNLDKTRSDFQKSTQGTAQKSLEDTLANTQKSIRDMLSGSQSNVLNTATSRLGGLNAQVAKQAQDEKAKATSQLQADIQNRKTQLQNALRTAAPGADTSSITNALKELDQLGGDTGRFIDLSTPQANISNALSGEEASQLNRISDLMGVSGDRYAPTELQRGGANVNKNAYDEIMNRILGGVPANLPTASNPLGVPQVQTPQSVDAAMNASTNRVMSTLPTQIAPQTQAPNRDVQDTVRGMLGVTPARSSSKNRAGSYNPFSTLGMR